MEFSTDSISNSISKGSVVEETSLYMASLRDAESRSGKGPVNTISNELIQEGDEILEIYQVMSEAIHGGMGSVWRVHHRGWNVELAMKRPQPEYFAEGSRNRKERFIAECENWINLGLHPNIVSCYYVREISGVPTIFSEWMDGGSLKDRIRDGSLYEGTEEEIHERLLDIAIQSALGLMYSHENGLVHQDMKPGNLLLTKTWEAKIADFGLANAQSRVMEGDMSLSSGYTVEYCPTEQTEYALPEQWMDLYAWALTVLEMYACIRLWDTGAEAALHYQEYFSSCSIPVPGKLREIITNCLTRKEDSFSSIVPLLQEIYAETTGTGYPRELPKAAPGTAESLNNRALSFQDIGGYEEASRLLETAEHIGSCAAVRYNAALNRWRNGVIDDDLLIEELRKLPEDGTIDDLSLKIAEVYLECGDPEAAQKEAGTALTGKMAAVCEELRSIRENIEPADFQPSSGTFDKSSAGGRCFYRKDDRCWVKDQISGAMSELHDVDLEGIVRPVFSPDGSKIAYAAKGKRIIVIRAETMEPCTVIDLDRPDDLCFSPDGGKLYVAAIPQSVVPVYEIPSGKLIARYGRTKWCRYITYSPDGNSFITGDEGKAELRDAATGCAVTVFRGSVLRDPVFSEDGRHIAMTRCPNSFTYKGDRVVSPVPVRIYKAGGIVCRVDASRKMIEQAFEYETCVEQIMELLEEGKTEQAFRKIEDGRVRFGNKNDALLMDLRWEAGRHMYRKRPVGTVDRGEFLCSDTLKAVCFSRNSDQLICTGDYGVTVYGLPGGSIVSRAKAVLPPGIQHKVCLSPDGRSIFVSGIYSKEKTKAEMYRINIKTGKQEAVFDLVKDIGLAAMQNGKLLLYNRPYHLMISEDGKYLLAELTGCAGIWDARTGRLIVRLTGNATDGLLTDLRERTFGIDRRNIGMSAKTIAAIPRSLYKNGNAELLRIETNSAKDDLFSRKLMFRSPDCRWAVNTNYGRIQVTEIEWEQEMHDPEDIEPAIPLMKIFRTQHPYYSDAERLRFLEKLQQEGFGYITDDVLRRKLVSVKPV